MKRQRRSCALLSDSVSVVLAYVAAVPFGVAFVLETQILKYVTWRSQHFPAIWVDTSRRCVYSALCNQLREAELEFECLVSWVTTG